MRILMTGATGLIGKEVGKRLVFAGHDLHVVTRNPESARLALPFPAAIFAWDAETNGPFPEEALSGVEAVIHLAGEPVGEGRWNAEKKKRIRDSRVLGTRRLVDAILENPGARKSLRAFVLGSAVGFYGFKKDDPASDALNEDSPPASDFLAAVVIEWEKEADRLASEMKVRLSKVRTGVVLARQGGALAKMLPVFTKGVGGKLGTGQQWMSWIHIDDIARLFVFCTENDQAKGIYNGTAPEPARNERFTVALARALGRPVFLPVPETAIRLAIGELAESVLGSQRVVPMRAQQAGFRFDFPELVPALEDLGAPLRGGVHELVSEQWIPQPPSEIFPFFCDEKNLGVLTPPLLDFRIVGKSTPVIEEGTLIDYKLKVRGLPMRWRTRIESWKPNVSFVDTQLKGPYRKWHHTHEFVPLKGGTLMRDRVLYQLPLGIFGDTAIGWRVGGDVKAIFAFRRKKIAELYGGAR